MMCEWFLYCQYKKEAYYFNCQLKNALHRHCRLNRQSHYLFYDNHFMVMRLGGDRICLTVYNWLYLQYEQKRTDDA